MVSENELKEKKRQLQKDLDATQSTLKTTRAARRDDIVGIRELEKQARAIVQQMVDIDKQLSSIKRKRRQEDERNKLLAKKRRQERKNK